jgi:hypothetical protein
MDMIFNIGYQAAKESYEKQNHKIYLYFTKKNMTIFALNNAT